MSYTREQLVTHNEPDVYGRSNKKKISRNVGQAVQQLVEDDWAVAGK